MKKRRIGIDYGQARIGLASAGEHSMVATVLDTVAATRDLDKNVEAVCKRLAEFEPTHFVVGLPLNMNGTDSAMTEQVRRFAAKLEAKTGVPVDLWDERLSSVQIDTLMKESGMKRRDRNKKSDAPAAALILQSYLESNLI